MISNNEILALEKILICLVSGILIKYSLVFAKQKWINNFQHTITCMMLPVITLVVTTVISGNIALSLGMVGALSIVRFRNPVKNTLEIVIYFALITVGIATAVNIKYSIALTLVLCLSIIFIFALNTFFKSNLIFSTYYSEGDNGNFIEIEKINRSKELENIDGLIETFYNASEKIYCYKIFFRDKKKALEIYDKYIKENDVLNIKHYNE